MTISRGRDFLAIPGPTVVPDQVLSAMHRPAIDIYSGPLVATTASCLADLKKLFRTQGDTYIYAANGHGAWEAALTNTLSRGDQVLVLESGRFARGWGEMGILPGLDVVSWRVTGMRQLTVISCRQSLSTTSRNQSRLFWWFRSIPHPEW